MKLFFTFLAISWLSISGGHRFFQDEDGKTCFLMGDTAWLMPEKLTREDVDLYLDNCRDLGFNIVQMQVTNDVPSVNVYEQRSGLQEYWYHVDYILNKASENGIYVAMDCIWDLPVRNGLVDVELADAYGRFLATRYKDRANVIWVLGGDSNGSCNPEIWDAMASAIREIDPRHLMTFHPCVARLSTDWFNGSAWLDFNMFQSGSRRYDQFLGDDADINASRAEDNWRFVLQNAEVGNVRPVLDAAPVVEGAPQGLVDNGQPLWTDADARRWAYWSVFEGSAGHFYCNNAVMQFHNDEEPGVFAVSKSWKEALGDPGRVQMQYLKALMDIFSCDDRTSGQDALIGNGERYERIASTRGSDFLLAYSYCNRQIRVELSTISGKRKQAWWYSPVDGTLEYIGEFKDLVKTFTYHGNIGPGNDHVLIVTDWKSSKKVKPLEKPVKLGSIFKK